MTKFGPPKGMRDWLPEEVLLRQKLIRLIESCYRLYGFQPIDTPVMENIEVLQGKGGGENEKLMFKVLKRGEELNSDLERFSKLFPTTSQQIFGGSDMGLRFDLTVPLARYFANHANELPRPFRCYHIGPVWRADRPQRGRFREFYQCDIDIVGGASDAYEVELLLATDRVLKELGVGKFKIRISDKRLLPDLLSGMGVDESGHAGIAVAIDKLDKQPYEQVRKEIETLGHSLEVLDKVDAFIQNALHRKLEPGHFRIGQAEKLWHNIESIRQRVHEVNPEANVVFDPLLVRGFDYYTGPVFEINVEEPAGGRDFAFSIGGGGRYDGLIERLGGPKGTPAVGLSLGFERILLILAEKAKASSKAHAGRVLIAHNGQAEKDILALAEELRSAGLQVEAALEGRKLGQQLEAAQKSGIEYAVTAFQPGQKTFKVRRLSTREDKEMTLSELAGALKGLSGEDQQG